MRRKSKSRAVSYPATAEALLVNALLSELERVNKKFSAADTGACLISTPGNPTPTCAQLSSAQCSAIGGVYVGGACPGTGTGTGGGTGTDGTGTDGTGTDGTGDGTGDGDGGAARKRSQRGTGRGKGR